MALVSLAIVTFTAWLASPVTAADTNGRVYTVIGDSSAIATVLIISTPDCPIARKYAPALQGLYRTYRPRGVKWFLVQSDSFSSVKRLREYQREFSIPFPTIPDPQYRLARMTGAERVPTAAVFTARGELVYLGRIDDRFPDLRVQRVPRRLDLARALDQLLNGKIVEPSRTPVTGCFLPPP